MESVRRFYRVSAALAAAAMLAACGGGTSGGIGSSGVTPSTRGIGTTTAASRATLVALSADKKRGKARINIKIPHTLTLTPLPFDKAKGNGHPKYISASTQSMTVAVAGVPTQTFNLTPTSPGCSTSDGSTSCSETAFFPTGQQTVTITLYDQQNGAGNQLSTASTSVTIASGAVTNVSITLNGVVATAKMLLNGSASDSIPEGTATSIPASVTAYDADNNIIMSPGNYSSPVTLADSDTSGATTLSTNSVNAPGAAITVSYSGGSISSATITPSVNGTAQPAGAATLTFTSPAAYLYVSFSPGGSSSSIAPGVNVYKQSNLSTVVKTITTGLNNPNSLFVDSHGNLWVGDNGNEKVYEYPPDSSTRTATYSPPSGKTANAVAVDTNGTVYILGGTTLAGETSIYVYPAGGSQTVPTATLTLPSSGCVNCGLALDQANDLYAGYVSSGTASIEEFSAYPANAGSNLGISVSGSNPVPLLDASGNLFVATYGSPLTGYVSIFSPGSTTPSTQINVGSHLVASGLAIGSTLSKLYVVANSSSPAVYVYNLGSYTSPATKISGFSPETLTSVATSDEPSAPGPW